MQDETHGLISDLIPKKSEKFEFWKNFVTIFFRTFRIFKELGLRSAMRFQSMEFNVKIGVKGVKGE